MEDKIKCIIVDDEPLAIEVLETLAAKIPDLQLIASCSSAIEANDILKQEDVDVLFLDIQMPQLSGIDFIKSLQHPPLVIFTTAHPGYAVEGFDLDAVDYLMKPISFDRFAKAIHRLREHLESSQLKSTASDADADFIFVKADKKFIKINFADILYIEGLKDYVIIRRDAGRIVTLQTMKSLEVKLPSHIFQRIHRSYIVNIDRIKAVIGNMVELIEQGKPKKLPIGKNYREEVLKIVNRNRL